MELTDVEFLYVRNHASNEVLKTSYPWQEGDSKAPVDRKPITYAKWLKNEDTDHCCISLVSASPWNVRVSNANAPHEMRGLIVDYDSPWDPKKDPVPEFSVAPNYYHATKRGRVHFIWCFSDPIPLCGSFDLYERYMNKFVDMLGLSTLKGGLDERSLLDPRTYYDIGLEDWWGFENDKLFPSAELLAIREEVVSTHKFKELDSPIPLEDVAAHLSQTYPDPGFSWTDFKVGKRCHRFWDSSGDAESCIVRETGISSWTGSKGFVPWSDEQLCGFRWVSKYLRTKTSAVVENFAVIEGGRDFYEKVEGVWRLRNKQQVIEALTSDYKLSQAPPRGATCSPVTECLRSMTSNRTFQGLSCFLYNNNSEVEWEGDKYLNSYQNRLLPPAEEVGEWGDNFPDLAKHLDGFFTNYENLTVFLSWWANILQNAHAPKSKKFYRAARNLVMIIAGETSAGKNFLNKMVCLSLGGGKDANHFFTSGDKYNHELVDSPVWRMDDPEAAKSDGPFSQSPRKKFAQLLKRLVANDTVTRRQMYASPVEAPMQSAVIITTNLDNDSLSALPIPNASNIDKMIILMAQKSFFAKQDSYPSDEELIEGELPHLIAYLLNLEIPDEFRSERFGVKAHYDLALKVKLTDSDSAAGRQEIIVDMVEQFGGVFTGTASELYDYGVNTYERETLFIRTFSNLHMLSKEIAAIESSVEPVLQVERKRQKSKRVLVLKLPVDN